METYVIRVNVLGNLYVDYIVEAETLLEARNKAKEAFFRDYPEADEDIYFSLMNPDMNKIQEITMIFKEGQKNI